VVEQQRSRKEHILECLAQMLESGPSARITTAGLARRVGVSEAALYRHFPSKAKMFEGLILFIEDTLFSRIAAIGNEKDSDVVLQCEKILTLLLTFSERNPGITRLLTGDALVGETERLHRRITQLYDRVETQLKCLLRDAELHHGRVTTLSHRQSANLMLAVVEGRIRQFVRSEFKQLPTHDWSEQWRCLVQGLFVGLQ